MLWRYERERAKQSAFAAAVAFGWMYAAMLMLCCAMIAMVAALFLLLRDQMPAELALMICAAVLAMHRAGELRRLSVRILTRPEGPHTSRRPHVADAIR